MVMSLSDADKELIAQATARAEQASAAEFAVVIARASDEYWAAALFCGLVVGCLIALVKMHWFHAVDFPMLLSLVPATSIVFLAVPFLRHACLRLLPPTMLMQRAAQRAAAEYVNLVHHLPPYVPVVLLYISLAERYVHIYTSREVREIIPDKDWDAVVATLTASAKKEGVRVAIIKAIDHGAEMLAQVFPPPQE